MTDNPKKRQDAKRVSRQSQHRRGRLTETDGESTRRSRSSGRGSLSGPRVEKNPKRG